MLGLGEVRQDGEQRPHLQPDGQRTGVRTARAAVGELTDLERDPAAGSASSTGRAPSAACSGTARTSATRWARAGPVSSGAVTGPSLRAGGDRASTSG
ncbi:hypothetical protein [Pseudonocardia sp. ICBG601]|uniref:hypothetical protein n=1 Tax=Pseudonocardia sp. ICBG601 TaxID=2846759 RepID=UPI001CF68837|nr:hypothetical protein [Pseudonocardia sp. ICBG601]